MQIIAKYYDTKTTTVSKANPNYFNKKECEMIKEELKGRFTFHKTFFSDITQIEHKQVWIVDNLKFKNKDSIQGYLILDKDYEVIETNASGSISYIIKKE